MQSIAIDTKNLTRTFGTVTAIQDVSIQVPAGIVFGYLGPNGSGKTTTIRLLLGLLEPSSGSAEVLGYDTVRQAQVIREQSGALLEYTGLYERMSAEDNLEFYGRAWHIPANERKARIQELLTGIDLWDRRKDTVRDWSRGMRQKLAVARALLHRPRLVFLDEPTAGLDPVAAATLRQDLERLVRQEGLTVFLTTHNLAEAEKLCDQVAVIRKGKMLAVGAPDELKRRQGNKRVIVTGNGFSEQAITAVQAHPQVSSAHLEGDGRLMIELSDDIPTAPLVQLLVGAGVEIDEVSRDKASLEDIFLTLVEEEND